MEEEITGNLDRKAEDSIVRRVAWYSLIVNTMLVIVKLYLSWVSGSLALEADAIHSFIDVLASIALIAGIWLSCLKRENYPYGLYKIENLVSVIIAFLVFLTAWEILTEAVSGGDTTVSFSGWVLFAVAALISVPYILGRYEVRMGRKYNSPGLIADGKQHIVDVLSTSVVFSALFAQYFGIPVDSIAAAIVAFFIAYSGWEILKDSMRTLLDASIDYDTRDRIKSAILSDPMVTGIKDLTARNSGRFIFVEATVNMKRLDLSEAHNASERIELKINEIVPNVERVVIHYEPKEKLHLRYAVPTENPEGKICPHFGEAPYFTILEFSIKDAKLMRKETISNPVVGLERQKGIRSAEFLLTCKPDVIYSKQPLAGKSAEYVFESAGILVKLTGADHTGDLIKEIKSELMMDKGSDPAALTGDKTD
ncbi:cation diffusion facilitator family transporter [Methanoplanus limicola]|uniref:Cation diffusion facilitator family transporter n=1 Tax=Methanoplanus limicola DSM 2279 TaxID=937775 RepID=H1Z3Q3_9EURY|nr:cation diffusion facilitator family transporter [Methanoplanus limicola]EHQ35652.1 cation diffusion facilitator family transporter [Methanoplanus limicola DSM 2279]